MLPPKVDIGLLIYATVEVACDPATEDRIAPTLVVSLTNIEQFARICTSRLPLRRVRIPKNPCAHKGYPSFQAFGTQKVFATLLAISLPSVLFTFQLLCTKSVVFAQHMGFSPNPAPFSGLHAESSPPC